MARCAACDVAADDAWAGQKEECVECEITIPYQRDETMGDTVGSNDTASQAPILTKLAAVGVLRLLLLQMFEMRATM